jgi:3-oxoacyl-[acyl-carrier protein] reductase
LIDFNGRTALVTGGTRGLGYAIADLLRALGARVMVTGTSPGGSGPTGCAYVACDFTDGDATAEFAAAQARLGYDVLVNNAAVNKVGATGDYDPADFARLHQVNVTAPFLLCRALAPGMAERGFGRIVNITSIFGVVSRVGRAAYSTTKFGLLGLSRALALEYGPRGVLVNGLAPGFVDTDLTRRVLGLAGIAEVEAQIPVGRLAKPDDIARACAFLASPANTYVTGQNIVVDGGFTSA